VQEATLKELEERVRRLYRERAAPAARRFGLEPSEKFTGAAGRPAVLFLGNHSSGKSSFINFLLGKEVQKTGLAPVDDGFTILDYAERPDSLDGHAVVTHPELPYRDLERYGPGFVKRLRMKLLPAPLLREVTLIDSPGMIDSADRGVGRGYDFIEAARNFAERADLILFFFDPDKPGTTGETMSVFTESLAGQEHKLLILLHKVDLFESLGDFARTYGTLCWNLSKVIRSKDMPHLYVTYLPGHSRERPVKIALEDFDRSREEVVREIRRAPVRRADNLVTALYLECRRLAMTGRVCLEAAGEYCRLRRVWALRTAAAGAAAGVAGWLFARQGAWTEAALSVLAGFALCSGLAWAARRALTRFREQCRRPEFLELSYRSAYRNELGRKERADLDALWAQAGRDAAALMAAPGPARIPRGQGVRWFARFWEAARAVRQLERLADEEIPRLRRGLGRLKPEGA